MKIHFVKIRKIRNFSAMAGNHGSIMHRLSFLLLLAALLMIPTLAASADLTTGSAQDSQQSKPEVSDKCRELTSRVDIDLKEVVRAGCQPSQAQLSKMMDNPVGSLVFVANQFYWTQIEGPRTNGTLDAYAYKLIPTFPIPIGKSWNLINRPVFSIVSAPLKKEVGNLIGMSETEIIQQPSLFSTIRDPFGRTSGFGDISYVGLLSPKTPDKVGTGIFVWGIGPTLIFPTSSETILGQGKYQAGPAGVAAYIGKKWCFGLFPQHWWSYAGDSDRSGTNMTNIQYFIYYNITDTVKIGMGPNATINWTANSSDMVTLPVGLGVNWMTKVGKLPVRFGIEGYYSVIHPQDTMGSRFSVKFTVTPVIPTFLLF